jgi:hypothetical protein
MIPVPLLPGSYASGGARRSTHNLSFCSMMVCFRLLVLFVLVSLSTLLHYLRTRFSTHPDHDLPCVLQSPPAYDVNPAPTGSDSHTDTAYCRAQLYFPLRVPVCPPGLQ